MMDDIEDDYRAFSPEDCLDNFLDEAEDDENEKSICFDEFDEEDDDDSDKEINQDNFTDAFISFVKGHNFTRCTHLDLSGVRALTKHNFLELINELLDY